MPRLAFVALVLAALAAAEIGAAAPPAERSSSASAQAVAVQVVAAGTGSAVAAAASAPPKSGAPSAPFAYPADGSVVSVQAAAAMARASDDRVHGLSASEAVGVSIFGGEITADRIKGAVDAFGGEGDLADTTVAGLVALGQPVASTPNSRVTLGDWGYAVVLGQSTDAGSDPASFHGSVTGLVVHLDADHGGLRAGSEIRIGFAEASAQAAAVPEPTSTEPSTTTASPSPPAPPVVPGTGPRFVPADVDGSGGRAGKTKQQAQKSGRLILEPPSVTPRLTAGGYVFPVYGPSGFGDTFGAARGDVSGGWHHGDDIFAPLGAPILAVTDGTLFNVGWNDIGGWRFWLRDDQGNEFYYAHLSAYTDLALEGAHVKAGDVIGFVGNTGDAQGTPYHLHFEVHPVAMLFLGYDGAVNPTPYLQAWQHLEDVTIRPAVGWSAPVAPTSQAPAPGAYLLGSSDISTASGLEPRSLERALATPPPTDIAALGNLPAPLPVLDRA
jgi:murein DD-endopeptidase MepM/ murein hydrolase activator NlpD